MESQNQNVRFNDQTPSWEYSVDSSPDPTFCVADTDDAELGNFFSRPVKIQSYSWSTGSSLFETFNPWQDFFENPRVINRLTNYNLLRCKLKVRIMLNGNSFHYGRALAAYQPMHTIDNFTAVRANFTQDVVAASQRPHVFLDPTCSQGGTLSLPFVWYENAVSIPDVEWRSLGQISLYTLQALKHANGATDQVIVSVFAWAEDVSLSIPTANEPGALSPQIGEIFTPQVNDEYGNGPVSRPANVIAKAAGALSNISGIGPYARATQMAASAVSSVASAFGYSRPVELASITPYKPTLLGNMANANVPDTSTKLTLDVKQELTVDPRTMGLHSTDEMTIQSIAQRESYLTSFSWVVAESAENLLWNTEVSPVLWNERLTELHFPACCFAALPFRRWRGSMKFRFQIVASAFHKGRLKITYDPSYPLTNEYNTNYTYIVDLAKERDFTVQIGWGRGKSILEHRDPGVDSVPYGTVGLGADPKSKGNGILSVYVVNDLTVPNSTANNDIEINVFVSAGDDFEVFDPDSKSIQDFVWFEPQSGEIFTPQMGEEAQHPDADCTKNEDEPMKLIPSETMAPTLPTDHTLDVYYGDPVTSFRQCLKRYNFHSSISPLGTSTSHVLERIRLSDFPYYRGYCPGAVHLAAIPAANTPYNYAKMTLLNFLTPAFSCRKGGIRWKYFRTGVNDDKTSLMMVMRDASASGGYAQLRDTMVTQSGTYSNRARFSSNNFLHTWDGAIATSTRQNPVVEAELPFFSNIRFVPAKTADLTSSSFGFRMYHWLSTQWTVGADDTVNIYSFVSTGEDFNLSFFTGCPIAYYVAAGTDPVAS